MGGLLTLPVAAATAFSVITQKGLTYTLRYVTSYIYLRATRCLRGRRFDLYDYRYDHMPEKTGLFIPQEEKALENPQENVQFEQGHGDDAYCFGFNSKSEHLGVYISRKTSNAAYCSLMLRLSDGTTYSLMDEHLIQMATEEENTFGSARLKIQCLVPMRKWRIFFNGILKKHSLHGGDAEHVHVKLVFLWTASSDVFDFTFDTSISDLADQASSSKMSWPTESIDFFQKFRDTFNGYEHPGMMLGSMSIENEPEIEMYLWGVRGRYRGKKDIFKCGDLFQIYGYFRDGRVINLSLLNVKDIITEFYYGYLMRPDGFIYPIENCKKVTEDEKYVRFTFSIDGGIEKCSLTVQVTENNCMAFQKELFEEGSLRIVTLNLNSKTGVGCIIEGSMARSKEYALKCNSSSSYRSHLKSTDSTTALTVTFGDASCQNIMLTGGKGASLGKLYTIMSEKQDSNFSVPKGIVVTTKSYEVFTRGHLEIFLENFQRNVWQSHQDDTVALCRSAVDTTSKERLPDVVKQSIISNLLKVFGDSYTSTKFAVRSSATGEDTDQTSAAGQNETFLGIAGINEVLNAVVKCWASQFTFQAVEYKRHCGQIINSPMAVVIQEMVPCDVAGVMFTCDPVTGNPAYINITANWGLGESVVSASAEPDTVILKRKNSDEVSVDSKQIGNKSSMVILNETEGTQTVNVGDEQSSAYCISNEEAVMLGKIAIMLEEAFGSPRDMEWGIQNGKVFLFQSRPVTSLDLDTDFEIKHIFDSYLRTENEYVTRANVGEVVPGALSPISIDVLGKVFDVMPFKQVVNLDGESIPLVPYYIKRMTYSYSHAFINIVDGFFKFGSDDDLMVTNSLIVSLFGRLIDLEPIKQSSLERYQVPGKKKDPPFILKLYLIYLNFAYGYHCRKFQKKIEEFHLPIQEIENSADILNTIVSNFHKIIEGMINLVTCNIQSSVSNMSTLTLLAKSKGNFDNDVYSDFAYLLSTCTDVESADVPAAIQDLGYSIARSIEPETFKNMTVEEAFNWLQTTKSAAGKKFKDFLKRHGHRCVKEFDMLSKTWARDSSSLVQILQNLVRGDTKTAEVKTIPSFSEIFQHMNIKLGFKDRLRLRWILPKSRYGVRYRELAKSHAVKSVDIFRYAFEFLADVMVQEGRLPNKDLLYFMCLHEMQQLIETRSARIISRAYRRMKLHSELNKLVFPELCVGIPKPINEEHIEIVVNEGETLTMKGTPVSKGIVKGVARVVPTLQDAVNIQAGDIMITHCTDIGWSPYFTLLSGIVTELGGLISHGAVVAREYGIPCIVGLHGATRTFKSGDIVILDGNKGILQKLNKSDDAVM